MDSRVLHFTPRTIRQKLRVPTHRLSSFLLFSRGLMAYADRLWALAPGGENVTKECPSSDKKPDKSQLLLCGGIRGVKWKYWARTIAAKMPWFYLPKALATEENEKRRLLRQKGFQNNHVVVSCVSLPAGGVTRKN